MGNVSSLARASSALDSYVAELGSDVSYEKSLSSSRFLKTILIRHAYGLLVLKLFIKPDPFMSLRVIQRRLKHQRDALSKLPNVLTYATFVETEKAGYLIRQYAGASLYDRISTRPYLSPIEKKWIAYQILSALRDARARDVAHGDLKSENILITPALTVLITDFASSFKPTFLALNDPSDFSYFYDSSGRRTCYVAPERFFTEDSRIAEEKRQIANAVGQDGTGSWLNAGIGKRDGKVTEEMDMFAAGCVLLEMWTDGAGIFTLSELYAYREGKSADLEGILGSLEDSSVRSMIASMLALNPDHRPTFEKILSDHRNTIFPDYFYTFLGDYAINLAADHHVPENNTTNDPIAKGFGQADFIILGICRDWDGIIAAMMEEHDLSVNREQDRGAEDNNEEVNHEDINAPTLLLLNVITSNIRNCVRESSKVRALGPLRHIAKRLTADELIDRVVPYLVALFRDDSAQVRAASLEFLVEIFQELNMISAHNTGIINDYILPHIRQLAEDDDVHVRTVFAQHLPQLSDIGMNIMEMSQALKATEIGLGDLDIDQALEPGYDANMEELVEMFAEQASTILVDPSSDVKRAALANVSQLCLAFGRTKTNEVLLSRMITYLNDKDWRLRSAFLEKIVSVAAFVGSTSLEEFVLPLMEQALADPENSVVARVLVSLASLTEIRLFDKARMLELFSNCYGFICHPDIWVRQAAASLIAAICKQLGPTEIACLIHPYLRPLMQSDLSNISQTTLLHVVLPSLPRDLLDAGRQWANRSNHGSWWSTANITGRGRKNRKAFRMSSPTTEINLNPTNEAEIKVVDDLRSRGLDRQNEVKFLCLRDYMAAQAILTKERGGASSSSTVFTTGKQALLQELNVTPVTVFLTPHAAGAPFGAHPDKLKSPVARALSDESRRNSYAGNPFRPRMSSHSASTGDVESISELRRKLKRLDDNKSANRDLQMTPSPVAQSVLVDQISETAPHQFAPSVVSIPSTMQGRLLPVRNRLSFGRDTAKAAPAISASSDFAVGRLEAAALLGSQGIATNLSSGLNTPRQSSQHDHLPPVDRLRSFTSTYEGHDPTVLSLLEQIYRESGSPGMEHLGPPISQDSSQKYPRKSRTQPSSWSGEQAVTLIAHLTGHRQPIKHLLLPPDKSYLLSASDDGSLCIWDISRFERSVSNKPRLTYQLSDEGLTAACSIQGRSAFAFASATGTIQIVRVGGSTNHSLKNARFQTVQRIAYPRDCGRIILMRNIVSDETSHILYVTDMGTITLAHMRTDTSSWCARQSVALGRLTCGYVDGSSTWLVVGTSNGYLALWDLRYGLQVRNWKISETCITAISGHPVRGSGKWVLVSYQARLWPDQAEGVVDIMASVDVNTGELVERFEVSSNSHKTGRSDMNPITNAHSSTLRADILPSEVITGILQAPSGSGSSSEKKEDLRNGFDPVRAIHCLDIPVNPAYTSSHELAVVPQDPSDEILGHDNRRNVGNNGNAAVLTAGDDKIIRLWNLAKPSDSFVVSGSGKDAIKRYKYQRYDGVGGVFTEMPARPLDPRLPPASRAVRKLAEEQSVSTSHPSQQATSISKPHLQEITAIMTFETPFSPALMIASADAAGAIKVWKVEVT